MQIQHFRLDYELTDSAHETAVLRHLQSIGVELGATITLWSCEPCEFAEATFTYPESREGGLEG